MPAKLLTAPPSAMMSVPVLPTLPIPRLPELNQREPAPVTVTVPCTVPCGPELPMMPPALVTTPQSEMVNMPMPWLPTMSQMVSQREAKPVTVTVPIPGPCGPVRLPIVLIPLLTLPPFSMVSVPLPNAPTTKALLVDQRETGPVTVTVPCDPADKPTTPTVLPSSPPSWIVSWPVP